ncbi:D-serine ammonia-lyase [Mesobacillus foraminis]|uniref:D-serine ammonia-lyase n=1 Tax=Mesobacillus foraminis TaxID=279826 RepID=UPI001BED14B6|nr:D-serine ammonia-lyase [Mesobacillus foraminis]MBT2759024.1 D-serine ammonia-lyase [Mesobacillus foraminis]
MKTNLIGGKSLEQLLVDYPLLKDLIEPLEVFWGNPQYGKSSCGIPISEKEDIQDASRRLERFASYLAEVFPETAQSNGIIESPLLSIQAMQKRMEELESIELKGKLLIKCDSHLPISGSIKAWGGIYEVLKLAEDIAIKHGLIDMTDNYKAFDGSGFKDLYSQYSIAVGSTGNLGLSIGIVGAQLGFRVTVHMSSDAKQWKKELLRNKGVNVKEYDSDYSKAVEEGRIQAAADPKCYFIDDENSKDLFLGYAVAASRLRRQFEGLNITVDENHPLFVYLPCGVGGGPGGVAYGLKAEFGDHVHCFFAEPTHSPCFLIGQMTGLYDSVSVQDFGLDNKTEADGLAVGRPSRFVGRKMGHLLSGCYTIEDQRLYSYLHHLAVTEQLYLEPSALAGFYGPILLENHPVGLNYLKEHNLEGIVRNGHHLIWGTGGNMVPREIMEEYFSKGARI